MAQPSGVDGLVEGADGGGSLVPEEDALGGQGEMVRRPVDEPDAQVIFQGRERPGYDGLAEAEPRRGPGDAALVGDREEGPQMAYVDTASAGLAVALSCAHAWGA